jgi:hypothetical protein
MKAARFRMERLRSRLTVAAFLLELLVRGVDGVAFDLKRSSADVAVPSRRMNGHSISQAGGSNS